MRNSLALRAALLSCAASSAIMPSVAFGQTDQQATNREPEIIVTATRRDEALKDVAMSVNVATGEDLTELNIFDAKDVQQLAPGLELTNTSGRNNVTTLRGITFDPDQGTSPAVQIYFNEIPVDAQTAFTSIYDIAQIEVLRGPQGLLRGLSAPAGAITFATRKPSFDEIEGYAQATATTRAGYNVQGGVSLPFSDTVSLRLAAVVDGNRLNQVRNITRGDRSRSRTESFRATLGLRPSDRLTAYLTYQYLTADSTQYAQVFGTGNTPSYQLFPLFGGFLLPDTTERSGPALGLRDRAAVSEGTLRFQNDTHIINLQASYDFGGATLAFVGAHQKSTLHQDRDNDAANAVPGYQNRQTVVIPYNVDTAELRLTSNNDEGFGWGLGAFYSSQSGTTIARQRADSFFFPTSVTTTPLLLGDLPYLPISSTVLVPVDVSTLSFNANLRFKRGPLKIEGGVRYSIIKNTQRAFIDVTSPGNLIAQVAPFAVQQDGIPAELQVQKDKPVTGGINVVYELTPDLNAYAAYGHSFRSGSAGVAVPVGISNDLIRSGSEKTDSWELGF
jgi:iron complex outermembrane receptor protein